jgi:hypothetical protein
MNNRVIVGDAHKKEPLGHRVHAFNAILPMIVRDVPTHKVWVHEMRRLAAPLGGKMAALISMYDNGDPTQTRAYNDRRVIEAAGKLIKEKNAVVEKLNKVYREGLLENELKTSEKVSLKPNEYAAELRATFRAMPTDADRKSELMQFAAKNNGAALAAITEAPSLLSGVTEEDQQRCRTQIYEIHAKEELAELAELNAAFGASLDAINVAGVLGRELNNPARLAEINMGVDAAAAAEAAFTAPISNVTV